MSDDLSQVAARLESLATRWSLVQRAHRGEAADGDSAAARRDLVLRYAPAIRGYVRAIMRGDAEADAVAQDAVLKLLEGKFAGADPARGRFRDLLKTSVRNLCRSHFARGQKRATVDYDPDQTAAEPETADDPWEELWRNQLLQAAWDALADYERSHPGSVTYRVLRLRFDDPEASGEALAARLAAAIGKPVQAAAYRQQLRRARLRFAEHLLLAVADSLEQPNPDRVEEELAALGLLPYVVDFLPSDWRQKIESNRDSKTPPKL